MVSFVAINTFCDNGTNIWVTIVVQQQGLKCIQVCIKIQYKVKKDSTNIVELYFEMQFKGLLPAFRISLFM